MTTTQNPLVIGIFQEEGRAKQALSELNAAGFAKDQLGFANTNSETANTNLGSELMKFGVPQEHAGYYHNAFQAGQHVVSVRADGREQDAARILGSYGATGLNSDPNAGMAMPNNASQMASYNTYAGPSQNAANQQQASNDPNYNTAATDMTNQQQYANPNYNNAGTDMANQQQSNNPNYNNPNYNNSGYANSDPRYNDPNQGFNQAQNYDPHAFQANNPNPNVGQERRMEHEERRMEREERENNNF